MKGLLITGGEKPAPELLNSLVNQYNLIVAADGGIDYALKAGIIPEVALGDMDSLEDPALLSGLKDTEVITVSPEKDETDTELGLALLKDRGVDDITLWGGGGGRLDHLLAIRALYEGSNPPTEWYTAGERVVLIKDRFLMEGFNGRRISLFPVGSEECRMRSMGLKWPLDSLRWDNSRFGISNIVTQDEFIIEMVSGRLILIHDLGSEDRG